MKTYVLHERWSDENEDTIIGVFSTPEKAIKHMERYYGGYKEISSVELKQGVVFFSKEIIAKGMYYEDSKLTVTLMMFDLDE